MQRPSPWCVVPCNLCQYREMDKKQHPHSGAIYQLIRERDGSFAVKVQIPDNHPTMVTGFATEPAAAAWIANHKQEVANGNSLRRRTFPEKKAPPKRG
jgi:hypothetical protein